MAETQPRITASGVIAAAAYAAMIGALVLIYLAIRSYGERLGAPAPISDVVFGSAAARANAGYLLHVLLALVGVIAPAPRLGSIFRGAHQPPVVCEISP